MLMDWGTVFYTDDTVLHCPVFYTEDSIEHCSTLSCVLHWGQCSTLATVFYTVMCFTLRTMFYTVMYSMTVFYTDEAVNCHRFLISFGKHLKEGVEHVWAFPSVQIPSWNSTALSSHSCLLPARWRCINIIFCVPVLECRSPQSSIPVWTFLCVSAVLLVFDVCCSLCGWFCYMSACKKLLWTTRQL